MSRRESSRLKRMVESLRVGETLVFELESSTSPEHKLNTLKTLLEYPSPPLDFLSETLSVDKMVKAGWVRPETILRLFEQKDRLDTLLDSGKYGLYKKIGESLFPQDKSGAQHNLNRAGDKLDEILKAVPDLLPVRRGSDKNPSRSSKIINDKLIFVDVCGAPGAFSDYLINKGCRGVGMSLRSFPQIRKDGSVVVSGILSLKDTLESTLELIPSKVEGEVNLKIKNSEIEWYPVLKKAPRHQFEIYWGPDGTGSVYSQENLWGLAEAVINYPLRSFDSTAVPSSLLGWDRHPRLQLNKRLNTLGAHIVGADGGIEIRMEGEKHMENYQELYCLRIIYSECLTALLSLRPGGSFVCKLFDTTSDLSATTLYLMLAVFDRVYIVKPTRSRSSNSEKYLCCTGYKGREKSLPVIEVMVYLHARGFTGIPGVNTWDSIWTPRATYPVSEASADPKFYESFSNAVTILMERQTASLKLILDETFSSL